MGVVFVIGMSGAGKSTVLRELDRQRQFDAVVLLTAPHQVLFDRLGTRTTNGYGKSPAERAEIGRYLLTVEPLLRQSSTHEISTDCSVEEVVAALINIGAGRATA